MSARKVKRIVLSDEEDGNDADCDEITESASAKKLAESINQLNVLDSAEKINNNKSSRKTLSEEARPKEYAVDGSKQLFYQRGSEEADGSKRQSSSTKSSFTNTNDGRRVSARSQTVTSKKENSRQKALNEMKNIRSRGLDAINFDESDEDAYSEVYDDESEEEEEKAEVLPRRSPKKPADRKKTDYEYSYAPRRSSSSGGTVNRLGPSAHTLKMFSEYRGNHEKEHDTYASDLDDFIVREEEDDEEEEEEEADAGSTDEDEADGEAEFGVAEGAAASQSPVKKKKGSRGKVIAVDEEEDEEEDAPQVSKSTKSRRVRRVLFGSDSEAESAEGDRKAAKNKKKSKQKRKREQTEDDEDDGPMLYWQVNAKMDEEMDDDPDELNAATAGHLFQMRQNFTIQQAFALYVELLGRVLISGSFADAFQARTLSRTRIASFEGAARQIENLVCTHRESLLGSSAWQLDFLQELQRRPFYMCQHHARESAGYCLDADHRCDACGRSAKEAPHVVFLYGPEYDALRFWSQNKWIAAVPPALYLRPARTKTHRKGNEEDGDGAEGAEDDYAAEEEDEEGRESEKQLSSANKNKQFSAFQQQQHTTGGAHALHQRLSAIKGKKADSSSTSSSSASSTTMSSSQSTSKKRSLSDVTATPSATMDEGQDGEDTQEDLPSQDAGQKKRRVILLSESEGEDNNDDGVDEEEVRRNTEQNSGEKASSPSQVRTSASQWWNRALPRALNQAKESRWELSIHCKNRTNLYHTLLHYKFRLLLKIREQLQKLHTKSGIMTSCDLESLPSSLLQTLLEKLLDGQETSFIAQETDRLQVLLSTAGRRYGGDKFEARDIWSEVLPNNDHFVQSSSQKSGSTNKKQRTLETTSASSTVEDDHHHTSANGGTHSGMRGVKNLSFVKKDYGTQQNTYKVQSRLTSWFTPKN